jgi:hypothetical protein
VANTDDEGAGLGRSDWARFFGQGIDNRYQAFADPRASGWTGGFQGGVDVWRGSILPGHRDAAGVYLAFANSNIAVGGLVTNAAATGYAQGRTPAHWASMAIQAAAIGPIMARAVGISTQSCKAPITTAMR